MAEDGHADDGVPASIEAAWGVRSRPGFGPRPGLSLDRIVATAVEMAAADGLAAVSMVKVARELGVTTMALYRYVASKDELLDLMVDAGIGPPPPPGNADPAPGTWREWLVRWAWDYLGVLRRHPWMLQIPVSGPPITPNQIAWLERNLASLRDTPLTEAEKLSVTMLLAGYVRHWGGLTLAFRTSSKTSAPAIDYGRALKRLADERDFPALSAAIAGGAIDDEWDTDGGEDEFVFGLDRILDGVEVLMRTRR
ncbi:TetR/AcrR family transcriptional regulator [Nonomuraea wenchangensis]|uniref:TetR/AcrR family transcriptional regulator n=1 Tax=Nonomuraea wenchangensis TaxID=568860 RepID=UPI00343D2413